MELFLTFFLVNTIFNTAVSGKAGNLAPVAIGLIQVFASSWVVLLQELP